MSMQYLISVFTTSLLVGLIPNTLAAVVPTAPSGGQSFNIGAPCPYQYTLDTTGLWTNMTIQLMTGDNFDMIAVTTVATKLDGTKGTGMGTWTCPSVFPTSAIYFYQFTTNGPTANPTWTTRFAIASTNGATTTPTNATQPGGAAIPWGTGKLVNAANTTSVIPSSSSSSPLTSSNPSSTIAPTNSSNATTMITSTSFTSSTGTGVVPSSTSTRSGSDRNVRIKNGGIFVGVVVGLALTLIV